MQKISFAGSASLPRPMYSCAPWHITHYQLLHPVAQSLPELERRLLVLKIWMDSERPAIPKPHEKNEVNITLSHSMILQGIIFANESILRAHVPERHPGTRQRDASILHETSASTTELTCKTE